MFSITHTQTHTPLKFYFWYLIKNYKDLFKGKFDLFVTLKSKIREVKIHRINKTFKKEVFWRSEELNLRLQQFDLDGSSGDLPKLQLFLHKVIYIYWHVLLLIRGGGKRLRSSLVESKETIITT